MLETDRSKQLTDDLALLREAASEAGRIAMRYHGKSPEVWLKDGISPVSEADLAVDRFLKDALLSARPDYGWISEETVDNRGLALRERTFIIDPIDGTRAFIEGRDQWCVSIAIVEDGRPIAGVLDVPVRGELLSAASGMGASQNGRSIHAATVGQNGKIRLASAKGPVNVLPPSLKDRVVMSPYIPSLAYRIAKVARGDIDGTFIRPNSHDWDLAAADLILHEAGGAILNQHSQPIIYGGPTLKHGTLVASSGNLLKQMLGVVAE